MRFNEQFIPISRLASRFDLPERYLKELADKQLIPCLNVNGRRRFNPDAVQTALDGLASKGVAEKSAGTVVEVQNG